MNVDVALRGQGAHHYSVGALSQQVAYLVHHRVHIRGGVVEIAGAAQDWTARVVETDTAAKEFSEVSVAKVSGGATFAFQPRKSLPLTVL